MGVFDYIVCKYPLPDGFQLPVNEDPFQTKDTPLQQLVTYTITTDGHLLDPDGSLEVYTGTINFYSSNWSSFFSDGFITKDDDPPCSRDYTATFVDGKLIKIVGEDTTDQVFTGKHYKGKEKEALYEKWRRE